MDGCEPKVLTHVSELGVTLKLLGDPDGQVELGTLLAGLEAALQSDWRCLVLARQGTSGWRQLGRPRHRAFTASVNLPSGHSIRFDAETGARPTNLEVCGVVQRFRCELTRYCTPHETY